MNKFWLIGILMIFTLLNACGGGGGSPPVECRVLDDNGREINCSQDNIVCILFGGCQ